MCNLKLQELIFFFKKDGYLHISLALLCLKDRLIFLLKQIKKRKKNDFLIHFDSVGMFYITVICNDNAHLCV